MPRRIAGVFGLVALLAAVVFPFAPVWQPTVTFSANAQDGPTAIPLLPYQPVELRAKTACAFATAAVDGQVLLSTVPLDPDPAANRLHGLRITKTQGALRVESAGVDLGTVPVPDSCILRVESDPTRTTVYADQRELLARDGDVRPDVAGVFADRHPPSQAYPYFDVDLDADTRFATTPTPLKIGVGVVGVLALLGLLTTLRRADNATRPRVRLLPRRWWRPRLVDGFVIGVLAVWWAVGSITVDDGYIAGIVRGRDSSGFIGNAYRWLNAPEAPFSWFYELYYAWSLISPSVPWMRVPSVLLGLLCWWLLSRLVLPRLNLRGGQWPAALALLTWWVPLCLGLRPEPWVAVGALGAYLAVERAVATRRLLPIAVATGIAAATTALTPGGIMAFAPILVAAVPLLRALRARTDVPRWPLLAVPAAAVFLMVPDQSLAGMLESVRVRTAVGGDRPWYLEFERYAYLLETASFQGAIGRRAAVLLTLLAAVGVLWALRRRLTSGVATGPARRLVLGLLLSTALMTVAPTKWTQHFGDLAGYGAAVLVLALLAWPGRAALPFRRTARSSEPMRRTRRSSPSGVGIVALGATVVVSALVLAGYNAWPWAGMWFEPPFSTVNPHIRRIPLTTIFAAVFGAVVAAALALWVWRRAEGREMAPPRWLPAPQPIVVALLAAVLLLQVGGQITVAAAHPHSYTLAANTVDTFQGRPCGLQERISVETDPAAGLLSPIPDSPPQLTRPVDVGGRAIPGIDVAGRFTTPWFSLDAQQRARELPVVVTTSGESRPGDELFLEFADSAGTRARVPVGAGGPVPKDVRVLAPPDVDAVRLAVNAPATDGRTPAVASLPRVPRLTPMTDLLPAGTPALLDWPVAFLFPCLTPAPLPPGSADVPQWRVGAPADDASSIITYQAETGGPFVAPRLLVSEQRMAMYLTGDPLRDGAQLYRWLPSGALVGPETKVAGETVPGWHRGGHARIPGIDPVG